MRFLKRFLTLTTFFVSTLSTLQAEDQTWRFHTTEYQPEETEITHNERFLGETATRFPFALGIHFREEEHKGYDNMWIHIWSEGEGEASLICNRVFEPIDEGNANKVIEFVPEPSRCSLKKGWNWMLLHPATRAELRFEFSSTVEAFCDYLILTEDKNLDPRNADKDEIYDKTSYRYPRQEFADQLFEQHPLMPIAEYTETVLRAYGSDLQEEKSVVDENGACLQHGKPFFPMMMYHSTYSPDEALFNELPLNIYPDRIPEGESSFLQLLQLGYPSNIPLSYEKFIRYSQSMTAEWAQKIAGMQYLYDEPDSFLDAVAQYRLHCLFKALNPSIPTLYCYCLFGNPAEMYRTSDYTMTDHYPIGANQPWCSVEAIGWIVDRMRWASGNRPVFHVVQTMEGHLLPQDQVDEGLAEGFPSERELTTLTFLPIAHGARGLYFYNWKDFGDPEQKTVAQKYPEDFVHLKRILFLLHRLEPVLVGPEVELPWETSEEGKARILVSADRKEAYLLVVNSKLHPIHLKLNSKAENILKKARYKEVFNYGVKSRFGRKALSFNMEELGCALYKLESSNLEKLKKRTTEEVLRELEPIAREGSGKFTEEAARLGRRGLPRPLAPERKQPALILPE